MTTATDGAIDLDAQAYEALVAAGDRKREAARALGIPESTLRARVARYHKRTGEAEAAAEAARAETGAPDVPDETETAREPVRYVGVAGVAAWLGVRADLVSKWLSRYAGTGHPTPAHDAEITPGRAGEDSHDRVWQDTPDRIAEWVAWEAGRPGQGAAGRPKHRHGGNGNAPDA